jgi:hypothetical protein
MDVVSLTLEDVVASDRLFQRFAKRLALEATLNPRLGLCTTYNLSAAFSV